MNAEVLSEKHKEAGTLIFFSLPMLGEKSPTAETSELIAACKLLRIEYAFEGDESETLRINLKDKRTYAGNNVYIYWEQQNGKRRITGKIVECGHERHAYLYKHDSHGCLISIEALILMPDGSSTKRHIETYDSETNTLTTINYLEGGQYTRQRPG